MFTGIIEELGKISSISGSSIGIESKIVIEGTKVGDSISVNGVCLTVTSLSQNGFTADISEETYKITALQYLKIGSIVNLERALPVNGRFGGHIVSGHVDSTGRVLQIARNGDFCTLEMEIDKNESNIIKSIIQVIYSSFDSFDEKKNKKLSDVISEEIKKRLGGEWFVFVTNANKEKQKIKFQISMFDEDDKSYLVINIGNSTFKIAKLK